MCTEPCDTDHLQSSTDLLVGALKRTVQNPIVAYKGILVKNQNIIINLVTVLQVPVARMTRSAKFNLPDK